MAEMALGLFPLGTALGRGYAGAMMNNTLRRAACLLVLLCMFVGCQARHDHVLVSAPADAASTPAQAVAQRTRGAATALLAALDDAQREKTLRPIDSPLRKDWHFIPREREGLKLGEMSPEQKTLAHALMQTALSDAGYLKATDIIWLETVLAEMEKNPQNRDPGKYALVIFGDPTDEKAAWGWRLEGHHLSLNLTYTPESIGVTPMFFGTNPAVVPVGPLAGKRVLADEHNLALQLAASMSDAQRKKMMLEGKPRDIITGPGRERALNEPVGLARADLSEEQYTLMLYLSSAFTHNLDGGHQLALLDQVVAVNQLDAVLDFRFAWAGPTDGSGPFYYRIQTPLKLIEYSCQGKNHVHSVIHDLTDPLQEDLLKKHFEQHAHD